MGNFTQDALDFYLDYVDQEGEYPKDCVNLQTGVR